MHERSSIDALVMPTRNGGANAVATALEFVDVAVRHGRSIDVCIAEDGAGMPASALDRLRRGVGSSGGRLRYLDRSAKLQMVEALVAAGCDRDSLLFALFDPFRLGDTTGANRNALQLATLGDRVLSVDDDLRPLVYAMPETTHEPAISRTDPSEFWFFADAAGVDAHATSSDPFAVIGRGLELPPAPGLPTIAAAWMGTVGDPGTPNGLYLLMQEGSSRSRLASDDARYLAHRSSRVVMRAVVRPTVCFGQGWTPAVVGYDHSLLLPPFFPVLRGEGLVFGAVVLAGGAWSLVRMPGALGHRLETPLASDLRSMLAIAGSMAVGTVLQMALARDRGASGATPPMVGLREVGRRLADLARSPSAFREFLVQVVELRARSLGSGLQSALDRHQRWPQAWARDVDETLAALARMRAAAATFVPYDLAELPVEDPTELFRKLVFRYSDLLEQWPAIVDAARRLDRGAWTPTLG